MKTQPDIPPFSQRQTGQQAIPPGSMAFMKKEERPTGYYSLQQT